jgi:hypothetical protein
MNLHIRIGMHRISGLFLYHSVSGRKPDTEKPDIRPDTSYRKAGYPAIKKIPVSLK